MTQLAELKAALDKKLGAIDTLRKEHDELKSDYIGKDAYTKLENIVQETVKHFDGLKAAYEKDLAETKAMAEEAALKAGRRGQGDGGDVNEDAIAHKSAFLDHLRDRESPTKLAALREAEQKALGSAAGSGEGVGVPQVLDQSVDKKLADTSVMLSLVHVVNLGTSDYKKLVNKGGANYGWVGAGDTRDPTNTSDHYQAEPTMGTIYAYPSYQEEQLDDVFFDIEGELIDDISDAFGNGIDVGVISGNGDKKMIGMLHNAPVATADGARADQVYQYIPSGTANTIGNADKLMEVVYTLKRRYRRNSSWLMNDLSALKVRVLKNGDGDYIWQDGLILGQPDRLLGYAVNPVDQMPDIAANSLPIGFGDWDRAYTYVNRHGTRITVDMITQPGFKKWHIRRRCGGMVTNDDAAKFLKAAAA